MSACALNPPDPLPLVEQCAEVPITPPEEEGTQLSFFYSNAIPDCSNGGLAFALYRHPESTFGTGVYEFLDDEPQSPTLTKHGEDQWYSALGNAVEKSASGKRLIVFIHGYATSFDEAHKDAAEVRELAGNGVPVVVIHWPSRNATSGYVVDRASIAWAQKRITRTIGQLLNTADDVTLVAHSLGAQALINSVIALDSASEARASKIKRIVLASPDFDRHQALRSGGIMDELLRHNRQILVYASRKDKALQLSRNLNGYARLGSTNCKFDVVFARRALGEKGNCHLTTPRDGLAIVDTGPSDAEGLVRHNDFLKSCQVREDLRAFLHDEPPPAYRRKITENGLEGFSIDPIMDFDGAPCDPIM